MTYTYELTAAQQAVMDAKAAQTKPLQTVQQLLDFKVAEYIEACSRDVAMDLDTNLAKAIFSAAPADKQAVLEMLEAQAKVTP